MSNSVHIPFEIAAMILGKLLRHNPGTFVVFCQMYFLETFIESFEYNTY